MSLIEICCLRRTFSSVLMWGHYTKAHQGFVLGIDISSDGFAAGIRSDVFGIHYLELFNSAAVQLDKIRLHWWAEFHLPKRCCPQR